MKRNKQPKVPIILTTLLVMVVVGGGAKNVYATHRHSSIQEITDNLVTLQEAKTRWLADHPGESHEPGPTELVPTYMDTWPSGFLGCSRDYRTNKPNIPASFAGYDLQDFTDPVTRQAAIDAASMAWK